MNDNKMRQDVHTAMDTCLSGVQPDSLLVQHILKGEKKTEKKKISRGPALTAALVIVTIVVVFIAVSRLPHSSDDRNAVQQADAPAVPQTETTTDPDHYGWKEYLADEGRPPMLPAVQEILDSTQEQVYTISAPAGSNPDDPQERPFTVYFTLQEQYADPYTAIISVHVTLPEGDEGFLCPEQTDFQIDPVVAKCLGVSEKLSWQEASEQLNCPMYQVWVNMDATEKLFPNRTENHVSGSRDVRCHEDGSLTFFVTGYLYGIPNVDRYLVPLRLSVQPFNSGIPIYDTTSGYLFTEIELPFRLEAITESRRYGFTENQTVLTKATKIHLNSGTQENQRQNFLCTLYLTDVQADMTPAGLYVIAEFTAEEILDTDETDMTLLLFASQAAVFDADGTPLPASVNDYMPANDSEYPAVAFTRMVNIDTFPESMTFELYNHSTDGDTTILSVPLTLSEDETIPQAENQTDIVGQSFELGNVTFTVQEQYADPYAATVVLHASLPEGEAGILCPNASTQTIPSDTADRLGVSQGITWAQAAKQLNLPLYGVRALFSDPANNSNTPGLSRNEINSDGSVMIYSNAFLTGDVENLPESAKLRLMALEFDTENPSNQADRQMKDIVVPLRFETISETQCYTIPDGQTGSSRFRYNDWDEENQQTVTHEVRLTFTPISAQADLTSAGVYVKVECRVAEEDIDRGLNFGLGTAKAQILGADGEVLPSDSIYAFPMDDTAWPLVSFTCMIDADSIPDTMTFELINLVGGQDGTVLSIELKK